MYDENELLEAVFESFKKWAFANNIHNDDLELIRQWATGDGPATLRVEIEDQVFEIKISEVEKQD